MMAEAGTAIHTYIERVFPFEKTETWIQYPSPLIKGKLDGYYNKNIIEIKTCKNDVLLDPNFNGAEEAKNQACVCSYIFSNQFKLPIENIQLLYIPRSLDGFKIFEFKYTNKEIEIAKSKIAMGMEFYSFISKKEVPSLNNKYVKRDQCRFCGYEKLCSNKNQVNSQPANNIQVIDLQ